MNKSAFTKQNENIKYVKKATNLKTLKSKAILFNKYIKILKCLHKILLFEMVNDKNHTIVAI